MSDAHGYRRPGNRHQRGDGTTPDHHRHADRPGDAGTPTARRKHRCDRSATGNFGNSNITPAQTCRDDEQASPTLRGSRRLATSFSTGRLLQRWAASAELLSATLWIELLPDRPPARQHRSALTDTSNARLMRSRERDRLTSATAASSTGRSIRRHQIHAVLKTGGGGEQNSDDATNGVVYVGGWSLQARHRQPDTRYPQTTAQRSARSACPRRRASAASRRQPAHFLDIEDWFDPAPGAPRSTAST